MLTSTVPSPAPKHAIRHQGTPNRPRLYSNLTKFLHCQIPIFLSTPSLSVVPYPVFLRKLKPMIFFFFTSMFWFTLLLSGLQGHNRPCHLSALPRSTPSRTSLIPHFLSHSLPSMCLGLFSTHFYFWPPHQKRLLSLISIFTLQLSLSL